jgi:hypothetical protein
MAVLTCPRGTNESAAQKGRSPTRFKRIGNPMNEDTQNRPVGKIVPKTKAIDPFRPPKNTTPIISASAAAAPKRERIRIVLPPRAAA